MTTVEALLDLWLERHDDDTPDTYAAAMTVDLQKVRIPARNLDEGNPMTDTQLTDTHHGLLKQAGDGRVTFYPGFGMWMVDEKPAEPDDMTRLDQLREWGLLRCAHPYARSREVALTELGEEMTR